jgi:molecular chaperone DnaK
MAKDCKSLARFELLDIPPARRGVPKIQVLFEVDANGILNVTAKDLGSNKVKSVRVRATSGLNEAEIQRIMEEAEVNKTLDTRRKEIQALRNRADGLIYTTERSLMEFGSYLTDEETQQIRRDMDRCRRALESDVLEQITLALQNLERSSQRIADVMYSEVT